MVYTRDESISKFAAALPAIMREALAEQAPYRDSFLSGIGLTIDQYNSLELLKKESIQKQWIASKQFKQMNEDYK